MNEDLCKINVMKGGSGGGESVPQVGGVDLKYSIVDMYPPNC